MSCSSIAHKKNPKHAVYSLQFITRYDRSWCMSNLLRKSRIPAYRVPPGILRGSLLLVTLIGSWSSFCNPCSQSEYRTNRRNPTETCNNSEPASICFVLFFTAIITRCQLFKTSWCSEVLLWGNPSRSWIKKQQSRNARFDWPQIGENTPLTGDRVQPKKDLRPEIRVKSELNPSQIRFFKEIVVRKIS